MFRSWKRGTRRWFGRIGRMLTASAVAVTGAFGGWPGDGASTVRAATVNVVVDPSTLIPVYGGVAEMRWIYEDRPHATTLETCAVTPRPPEVPPSPDGAGESAGGDGSSGEGAGELPFDPPTPYDRMSFETIAQVPEGQDREYAYVWDGSAGGRPLRSGRYTVCIVPNDAAEYFNFYDGVTIRHPAPPAPAYVHVVPNLAPGDGRHRIRGIAERGTLVRIEIRYTKRVGGEQTPGEVEHYTVTVPFDDSGTNEGSHLSWSKDKPLDGYFSSFPFRADNRPAKYVREWELAVELHPYEIAEITASAERLPSNPYYDFKHPENNRSGVSALTADSRVLRYVAPEWNINWEALAGYYYRADSVEAMVRGAERIAADNGLAIAVCEDGQRCPGFIAAGWNLIVKEPLLAGAIAQEEFLRDLTHEMIANRASYPRPLWWDPINLATGDFWFRHTNLQAEGALPLEFTVTYHSRDSYDGAVGFGWHHSFEWRLEKRAGGVMLVVTPEGARYPYVPALDGSYLAPAGTYNTLRRLPNGAYELQTPQHMRYRFREDGRLTAIEDTNGNRAVLTYQGTVLKEVTTDGARLTFVYGRGGKIASVIDQAGRRVVYEHDENTHDLKSIRLPDGAAIRFEYNDRHQITAIHNPNGTGTLINVYDEQGRVVRQRDFSGSWGEIAYDSAGRKTTTTDPLGRVKVFEYDERYRQTAIRYPDGTVERFAYDENDNLIRKTDRNGHVWTYAYDASGNLRQVTDPLGHTTDIAYNRWNKPETITDALGHVTRLTYDGRGNLIAVTDALGQTTVIERDGRGRPLRVTNAEGETVSFSNDAFGFVQAVTDAAGFRQTFVRDAAHRVTEVIDAAGNRTRMEYDPRDRVVRRIDALSQEETFMYDADSNLIRYTDRSGAVWTYAYDAFDRLTAVTDPLGQTETFEYDAVGNRTRETDARGASTAYMYDDADRVKQIVDPEGGVWTLTYDGNGNLVSREDPRGGRTTIAYDARNLPVAVTDALGQTTAYEYDALGRLIAETDALGRTTRYEYDALGRLTAVVDALSNVTSFAYDKAGRLVRVTKPNGAVWHLKYDARGLLTATVDPLGNRATFERDERGRVSVFRDETGATTMYTYDALGRLKTVTDALGRTTAYAYDALGRVIAETDALGRTTRYEYDLKGQLTKRIDPLNRLTETVYDSAGNPTRIVHPDGTATDYVYDALNRLTAVLYADGTRVDYVYDAVGNRVAMTDASGTTTYAYDALNRLVQVTDARGKTIRYAWTPTGQRSRVTDPDGGVVEYAYDLLDRVTEVADGQGRSTRYAYDARGLPVWKRLPTGAMTAYTYDAVGQLLAIRHTNPAGKLLEELRYAYDPVGNRIRVERLEGGNDEDDADGGEHPESVVGEYAYDALDRLIQARQVHTRAADPVVTTYRYDAVGNRLAKETRWGGVTSLEMYTYDAADRLLRWQSGEAYKDFTYDTRGNLLLVTGVVTDGEEMAAEAVGRALSGSVTAGVYGAVYGVTEGVYGGASFGADPWSGAGLFAAGVPDEPRVLEQYGWDAAGRLTRVVNAKGDEVRYAYDGDGNRVAMIVDVARGPEGRGNENGKEKGNGNGNGPGGGNSPGNGNGGGNGRGNDNGGGPNCHVVPPGFVPPGLAKKCGQTEEAEPEEHPGGPRDGWEKQYKKKHWEFHFTNDVSLALPEVLMATEADETKWKQTYVYGGLGERLSMTYLPAYDHDNGWEPDAGAGGAEPGVSSKTLYYLQDALGSVVGLEASDGRVSVRYHYDEFGVPLDGRKLDPNWPGPDNWFGYTGLGYDVYSGLTYARARYYQAEIGRFLSEDAYEGDVRNPQSLNLYAYVRNNPLKYVDPSGHYCVSADGYWAHGGACESSSSYFLGDDQELIGLPLIENGILIGYLGVGPVERKPINYYKSSDFEYYLYISDRGVVEDETSWFVIETIGSGIQAFGKYLVKKVIKRAISKQADEVTGTVWDFIKPTQPNYPGTNLPRSFELKAGSHRFWVHGNATEHMNEYITRYKTNYNIDINTQALLTSFRSAVEYATINGIRYEEKIRVGPWEFVFGLPREEGKLPAIYHAMYYYD